MAVSERHPYDPQPCAGCSKTFTVPAQKEGEQILRPQQLCPNGQRDCGWVGGVSTVKDKR